MDGPDASNYLYIAAGALTSGEQVLVRVNATDASQTTVVNGTTMDSTVGLMVPHALRCEAQQPGPTPARARAGPAGH